MEAVKIGIDAAVDMVNDFNNKKVGRPRGCACSEAPCAQLLDWAESAKVIASELLEFHKQTKHSGALRGHLIIEEGGHELLEAMASGNETSALDALADLLYVVLGTAAELDLPIGEAFLEVHRSNMTKKRVETDPDGCRIRDKGPDYVPPDLGRVLREYRASQVS